MMDLLGVARRLSSLSASAGTELLRQQVSRRRLFAPPPASPPAPGSGGVYFAGPSFEANRRYPVHYLRQVRTRAKFFPSQAWQPPILPGNQVLTPSLGITRRIGAHSFYRRLPARPRFFIQPLAAPVPPRAPVTGFLTPSAGLKRRYALAYHRALRSRTRIFISGGGILEAASPGLTGAGTLTASATITQQAAVAFSGTGSLDVFVTSIPKYTSLSYIPADTSLYLTGHGPAEQAQCQLGTGANVVSGTTDFGFVDTTYTLSKDQILATCSAAVL